jgi:Ser-tRNA(Ala) deacylase AlaX
MMTAPLHKLFWDDPYQSELNTVIRWVQGPEVGVEATIFYAFSGGQESDHGTLGGYPVLAARKDGLDIRYTLPDEHRLQVSQPILMTIDWGRRYRLMRLHFAAELILALVYRAVPGIYKSGAHIAQEKARIDFDWEQNISSLFPVILPQAQALITEDHPILSSFSDEAIQRRTWEILGFEKVACGGTHLQRTGEIGPISLKRKNVGKGKERIEIYADSLA